MSQSLSLLEQLKNLEHLQELDLKIDSLKKGQSLLPAGLKAVDDSLNRLKTTLNSKKNEMNEIEKVRRQAKAALDLNQDRLTRSNSKLEGVQNSQEFQAANKEIEQLKKLNLTLEEQDKKAVADLDALQKTVDSLSKEIEVFQKDRDEKAATVSNEDSQFKTDIASLVSERTKFLGGVEARLLAQYDRVRGARGGLGIVPAHGGRCKGCNMMVPPQLYNEVQKGSTIHSCPSCHRILFVASASSSVQSGDTKR